MKKLTTGHAVLCFWRGMLILNIDAMKTESHMMEQSILELGIVYRSILPILKLVFDRKSEGSSKSFRI